MNKLNRNRRKKVNPKLLVSMGVLIVGMGIILFLVFHHKTTPSSIVVKTAGTTTATKPSPEPNTVVTNQTPTPTVNVTGGLTGDSDTTQPSLTAPVGTFVSNHGQDSAHPVTASTTEVSSCTTTPGASCDIKFINAESSATADLGVLQTSTAGSQTESPGTVSWTWTPEQVNLTSGSWTVEAVATLNGQTKTTTDSTLLTISP